MTSVAPVQSPSSTSSVTGHENAAVLPNKKTTAAYNGWIIGHESDLDSGVGSSTSSGAQTPIEYDQSVDVQPTSYGLTKPSFQDAKNVVVQALKSADGKNFLPQSVWLNRDLRQAVEYLDTMPNASAGTIFPEFLSKMPVIAKAMGTAIESLSVRDFLCFFGPVAVKETLLVSSSQWWLEEKDGDGVNPQKTLNEQEKATIVSTILTSYDKGINYFSIGSDFLKSPPAVLNNIRSASEIWVLMPKKKINSPQPTVRESELCDLRPSFSTSPALSENMSEVFAPPLSVPRIFQCPILTSVRSGSRANVAHAL